MGQAVGAFGDLVGLESAPGESDLESDHRLVGFASGASVAELPVTSGAVGAFAEIETDVAECAVQLVREMRVAAPQRSDVWL